LTTLNRTPRRGEVWLVGLDPTVGAEIKKTRPVVVVSSDSMGRLPIKLVAPITGWDDRFAHSIWHIRVEPTQANGLDKVSAIDTLQLRGLDTQRFVRLFGHLPASLMEETVAAIAAVIEYE
jgi:mRNA interferase MazF